jgi:hypothetical protein
MGIKKNIAIGLVFLMTHSGTYIIGSSTSRGKMLDVVERDFIRSNAAVNLGRYVEYRDIALSVKSGNYGKALCISSLGASAMYDDLQACIASQECAINLESQIRNAAPEVLGEAPLEYEYYEINNGVRSCGR